MTARLVIGSSCRISARRRSASASCGGTPSARCAASTALPRKSLPQSTVNPSPPQGRDFRPKIMPPMPETLLDPAAIQRIMAHRPRARGEQRIENLPARVEGIDNSHPSSPTKLTRVATAGHPGTFTCARWRTGNRASRRARAAASIAAAARAHDADHHLVLGPVGDRHLAPLHGGAARQIAPARGGPRGQAKASDPVRVTVTSASMPPLSFSSGV